MSQSFSFSFGGDDIEDAPDEPFVPLVQTAASHAAEIGTLGNPCVPKTTAFPISGQDLLPTTTHSLESLIATLPSKIAYSTLTVILDNGEKLAIPRREWWDVRVQIMAEEDVNSMEEMKKEGKDVNRVVLGKEDVNTGVYEGGFKSWESSVDLVKVLANKLAAVRERTMRVLEMGCGTALPSLAVLQLRLNEATDDEPLLSLSLALADYNPSVLQLVTLPNILLAWAQCSSWSAGSPQWTSEGELDISPELLDTFTNDLVKRNLNLSFYSGAWSSEFVTLVTSEFSATSSSLLVLAAETIYSPFALRSFSESLMAILGAEDSIERVALVAAKKVYFGVGGSIEDFVDEVERRGGSVELIKEEEDGVRRAVVEVRSCRGQEILAQQMKIQDN